MQKKQSKYIIGIDEAGRGPLAGPVSVSVFALEKRFTKKVLKDANDSKKLTVKKREEIFLDMYEFAKEQKCFFEVSLVSEKVIDKKGISFAIKYGLSKSLKKILQKIERDCKDVEVFLDGSLYAPKEFTKQKTIIKGDSLIPVIGMASVMAKVTRDRYMIKISKKYPQYDFHIHKGYGTKKHIEAIKKHGISDIHRKTWIKM